MWFLAIRHLLSRRRQSLLTLAGIVLGTAAYIGISGMMMGFQSFIIDQLVNNDAHVRVSAREELITEHSMDADFFGEGALLGWIAPPSGRRDNAYILYPRAWFDRFDADPDVAAYSPQLQAQVIVSRGKISLAARLIGSEPERQTQVTNIDKYMLTGKFSDLSGGSRVVAGDGLLKKLGATVPETILLSVGKGRAIPFKIVGRFHLGVKTLDDTTLFGALTDVQQLNETPSRVSDIAIRLHDVTLAGDKAANWNAISEEKVQSWDQANEGIMSVFTTQDIVRNSMTISILIVAGFGIYNILNMAVSQKRKEIAILRSMGYLPSDILRLFLIQGVILGLLGGVIGCGLGYLGCRILATIRVSAERGLGGDTMMVSFVPWIYVRGFFLAFGSASLAGLLPARSAGRLNPIEIIRSEGS